MSTNISRIYPPQKRINLIIFTFLLWLLLVYLVIWPWIHKLDKFNTTTFSILAHTSALIWWIVLYWAFHHLSYQVFSLFKNETASQQTNVTLHSIALLYPTCDDFVEECCQSCLEQDYEHFRVIICDDSKSDKFKRVIDRFINANPSKCSVIRRENNKGYKAGNLNNAISNYVNEDWICIVDADQYLPRDYLSKLVKQIPKEESEIAYIQAANDILINNKSSYFQKALSNETHMTFGHKGG